MVSAVLWAVMVASPVELELDNGLRLTIERDARGPLCGLALAIDAGSADDPPGRAGLAHLVEHLVFRRTAHLDGLELFGRVQSAGGEVNGFTGRDRTVYWIEAPADRLEEWLWILAEQLALDEVRRGDFALEKDIVLREFRERDEVVVRIQQVAHRALYPVGHRYHPRERVERQMARLELGDVEWFLRAHHTPSRARLAVVAPHEPRIVEAWVRRYFEPIPANPGLPMSAPPPATRCPPAELLARSWLRNPRLVLTWAGPDEVAAGPLAVAIQMLGDAVDRRLENEGWDPASSWSLRATRSGFEATLTVVLPADQQHAGFEARVFETLRDVIDRRPSVTDVEHANELRRYERIRSFRSPRRRATWLVETRPADRIATYEPASVDAVAEALALVGRSTRVAVRHELDPDTRKERIEGATVCR